MVDIQSVTTENRLGKNKRRKKETTAAKYNRLPYWVTITRRYKTTKIYNKARLTEHN